MSFLVVLLENRWPWFPWWFYHLPRTPMVAGFCRAFHSGVQAAWDGFSRFDGTAGWSPHACLRPCLTCREPQGGWGQWVPFGGLISSQPVVWADKQQLFFGSPLQKISKNRQNQKPKSKTTCQEQTVKLWNSAMLH